MTTEIQIPDGYLQDRHGHLIPISKVKTIDKLRDELVQSVIKEAIDLQQHMQKVKDNMNDEIQAFLELSSKEYGVEYGGKKGNVSLFSYDGKYKVQISVNDRIQFDERLQIAKQLIDECVLEWSDGSNDNIKAIVKDVFQVDKAGKISPRRVLGLRRVDIDDEKWLRAMQAITDSIQVTESKEYTRLYQRRNEDEYQQISLDFSAV